MGIDIFNLRQKDTATITYPRYYCRAISCFRFLPLGKIANDVSWKIFCQTTTATCTAAKPHPKVKKLLYGNVGLLYQAIDIPYSGKLWRWFRFDNLANLGQNANIKTANITDYVIHPQQYKRWIENSPIMFFDRFIKHNACQIYLLYGRLYKGCIIHRPSVQGRQWFNNSAIYGLSK